MGISTKASQKEIKDAYRKLALRYHPDKNPDNAYAEERFKELSHAYQVLRDPARKAQHDFALIYEASGHQGPEGNNQSSYTTNSTSYGQPIYGPPPSRTARNRSRKPSGNFGPLSPADRKKNLLATAWAFGICFVVALVVFGFSGYQSWQQEKLRQEQNELAANIYNRAEEAYRQQNYVYSLSLLNAIGPEIQITQDVNQLREKALQEVMANADRQYEEKNFEEAARLYQLMADHLSSYDAMVYAKLVSSYEMVKNYPRAIEVYKQVIRHEPLTIEARNRIAALLLLIKDYEQAIVYYQEANEIIVEEYENYYGKAYALLVNPAKTPDSHYQLHCGLAHAYTETGLFKQADSAIKWAIFLRPGKPEAFFLKGNNLLKADRTQEACKAWKTAKDLGLKEAEEQIKAYCR